MRSTHITKSADVVKKWYVVDAQGKTLGRLASEIAKILRGKHKPIFQPHVDCGDNVIIVNAEKVEFTGNKLDQKIYWRHSGYIGGLKTRTLREQLKRQPEEVLRHAIKGMLPKGALGRAIFKKLHVYAGGEHKHQAQKPEVLEINY